MGVTAEAKKAEAKDPPILQPNKKEYSPPSTRNHSQCRSCQVLDYPPNANQECVGVGKEEGEESEAKLRGAIEISEGAVSTIASSWRDPWRATSQEYRYYVLDQNSLQGSLSRWKPIQALPPLFPPHCLRQAHGLGGCLSETVNPLSPPVFSLLLASFAASLPRLFCSQL